MARIEWVDGRLREWGEWRRAEGRSGDGYPTRNCLDPDWGRPGRGAVPTFKVGNGGRGARTNFHINALSQTLRETLVRHYVANEAAAVIAEEMKTSPATVFLRISRAHAALAHVL